ncbi:protein tyrosine phosphatase family protein [Shewanella sp. D64]|uniref:protein tyrosine phosphatase family protein n=1 Tax=unclassified Shewanella TaxID=196818 RepID=UPI0022BA5B5D|nr:MULTISPECIES: protein tyrosine phosphatase family protein [unclassified Shewanella]MEC4726114.1 protein tyrosine phosphatase family protein [Shewanella sp. D64]MEC4737970.1 protein tyrosine phosphatase family protein [Shewanella sp. E94]WBJ96169.1 protein tyrosine phosphatase family protein [Shewanella sp. MTB7]
MNKSVLMIALLTSIFSLTTQAAISPDTLEGIKAIEFNNDNIITSGLPSKAEFSKLQQAGVDLVINLIPAGNASGHQDEASLVTGANMEYVHIGVDWNKPTREDVEQFFKVMDANSDKDILIHCAANYRASAFYYLYQLKSGAIDSEVIQESTLRPWGNLTTSFAEYPQWHKLIEEIKETL